MKPVLIMLSETVLAKLNELATEENLDVRKYISDFISRRVKVDVNTSQSTPFSEYLRTYHKELYDRIE